MTIAEIFDQNNVKYSVLKKEKGKQIIKFDTSENVLYIKSQANSAFKMSLKDYELLEQGKGIIIWLIDSSNKNNFYLKFMNKTNWIGTSFMNCTKNEIFLGKQVLNNRKLQKDILKDLIKM